MRSDQRRGGTWARGALSPAERDAVGRFIRRVRREVPAELVQATLFGSKARGEARPDSDLDILLVFARLAPDREPHATIAERIADDVAAATGVPVTTWSVSLIDLELGNRTPMLVDALEDGVPLWWRGEPLPRLAFTPPDAVRCAGALLQRVAEGIDEVRERAAEGDHAGACRRARDDLVRMCTAALLLRGVTRPRRGDAVGSFVRLELRGEPVPEQILEVLRWAQGSFGPRGSDEEAPVPPPPGGLRATMEVVEGIRRGVCRSARRLGQRLRHGAGT